MQVSTSSVVTSGRAASCIATIWYPEGTAWSPLYTESCLVAPAGARVT